MALRMQNITVDCADPRGVAEFWSKALNLELHGPEEDQYWIEPGGDIPDLLFLAVPDEKRVKNRWHLDLRPDDQQAEVERLTALGAHRVDIGQGDDVHWVVMADPEGNEFCVLRPRPSPE